MKNLSLSIFVIVLLVMCPFQGSIAKSQTASSGANSRYFDPSEVGAISVPDAKEGVTYYVDGERGNDSWDGRSPSYRGGSGPFKTIGKALDRYSKRTKGGNTIKIRAGLYRTRVNLGNLTGATSEASRFTIGPYGDGEVIIDASDTHLLSWSRYPGNPNIHQADCDLKLRGSTVPPTAVVLDNDFKSCRPVYHLKDVTTDGRWYYDQVKKKLYLHSAGIDPRHRDVIVVKKDRNSEDYGFYLTGDYVTVCGLTVRGAGSYGIHILGDHNRIEKCTVKYSGKAGIKVYGKHAALFKNHIYGNVMLNWPRGNTWDSSGGWPNGMAGGSYARIAGNVVHDNGGEGIGSMGGAGGLVVEDNISYDNWSVNIYLDNQPNDIVRRNLVYCTGLKTQEAIDPDQVPKWTNLTKIYKRMWPEGIVTGDETATNRIAQSRNHQICNNIIINCSKGYSHYGQAKGAALRGFVIANNTIIMPNEPSIGDAWVGINIPYHSGANVGNLVKNNIVVGYRADTPLVNLAGGSKERGIELDYNLYFRQGGKGYFHADRFLIHQKYDFEEWKRETSLDAHSVFADPSFLKPGGGFEQQNYRPRPNSPTIHRGSGDLRSIVRDDFDSVPRTASRPTIGAFE